MTTNSSSSSTTRYIIYKVYGISNKIQAISAISFSTFALIHGLQITSTLIGGPSSMDSSLLLGRPFYQDERMEGLLVTGSITWHLLAGFTKSSIQYLYFNRNENKESSDILKIDNNNNNNNNKNNNSNKKIGILPYHDVTGQLLVPLIYGHYILTRGLPKKIMGDSAFIDVGIISWGLQNKKWLTWTLHLTLIGTGVYHMISGFQLAYQRTFKSKRSNAESLSSSSSSLLLNEESEKEKEKDHAQKVIVKKNQGYQTSNIIIIGVSTILVTGLVIISRVNKIPMRREYQDIYSRFLSLKI
ncbi:hypothetical protein BJ944DRAFT_266568 [Cunninghamella echinulata]|nr:hypothetical protein BJ944DRAFT_266568 [Cunninghamella echinulata]